MILRDWINLYENISEQPAYEHDCDQCIFVGQDSPREGEPKVNAVDMYIHRRKHPGTFTLIRRYGSEGSNYAAYILGKYKTTPSIYEPVLEAGIRIGVIPQNITEL